MNKIRFGLGGASRPQDNDRELDPRLGALLERAGVSESQDFDVADLQNTLYEQTVEAEDGAFGEDVQHALEGSRRIAFAVQRNYPLLPALLSASQEDEVIAGFLVSTIKSYLLVKAIVEEDEDEIAAALELGPNAAMSCIYHGQSYTPLVQATSIGNTSIIQMLLEAGAGADSLGSGTESSLVQAARSGDYRLVSLLLEHGVDPNVVTQDGTPLSVTDDLSIILLLAAAQADPNITDATGELPIMRFIDQGRLEVVRVLIMMGADLELWDASGENARERAARSTDDAIRTLVLEGVDVTRPNEVLIPYECVQVIEERIEGLLALSYPLDLFYNRDSKDDLGFDTNRMKRHRVERAMAREAEEAMLAGDLIVANGLFLRTLEDTYIQSVSCVWGWFEIMLLAKNFADAALVLRYYHAIAASINNLRKNASLPALEDLPSTDSFMSLTYEAPAVFAEATGVSPFSRRDVERTIAEYGGSFYSSYSLDHNDYDSFVRFLIANDRPQRDATTGMQNPACERQILEASVRSKDVEAYSMLARLVYEEDRQRAIDLCERAIRRGERNDAPFFLSWLLQESDPERSRKLLEDLVEAGNWYGAANNLALMIEGDDPERARELYLKAIEQGNRGFAAENLAGLLQTRLDRPEEAAQYYEMALESGHETTKTLVGYASLLMFRDPARAERLLRRAMEMDDGVTASCRLAHLLFFTNPAEAESLYRRVIGHGSDPSATEAYIALSLLFEEQDARQAQELLRYAETRDDFDSAVASMARMYQNGHPEHAERLRSLVKGTMWDPRLRSRLEQFVSHNARHIGICALIARLNRRDARFPTEFCDGFLLPSSKELTGYLWKLMQTNCGKAVEWKVPEGSGKSFTKRTSREFMRYVVESGKDALAKEAQARDAYDRHIMALRRTSALALNACLALAQLVMEDQVLDLAPGLSGETGYVKALCSHYLALHLHMLRMAHPTSLLFIDDSHLSPSADTLRSELDALYGDVSEVSRMDEVPKELTLAWVCGIPAATAGHTDLLGLQGILCRPDDPETAGRLVTIAANFASAAFAGMPS